MQRMRKIFSKCTYDWECVDCTGYEWCIARKQKMRIEKRIQTRRANFRICFLALLVAIVGGILMAVLTNAGSVEVGEVDVGTEVAETTESDAYEEITDNSKMEATKESNSATSVEEPCVESIEEETEAAATGEEPISQVTEESILEETEPELPMQERIYSDEIDLLARVIHCEAGICDEAEKYYVGTVPMNRIISSQFPNTLYEVIYEEGQYGSVPKLYKEQPTQREYEIAYDIWVNGVRTLDEKVVFQTSSDPSSYVGEIVLITEWHYYATSMYDN